jgi:hypothetical protein
VLGRVVPQSENPPPSSWHWNFVTACESVYVNDAEVDVEGFAGELEIVGAGVDGVAEATPPRATTATVRAPSRATAAVVALLAVLTRLTCRPPNRL